MQNQILERRTTLSQFQKFKSLHQSDKLFILPNVWNPKSAILFQASNFEAVGTSSSAVANSLGYQDGEQMQFEEYLFIIKRILASIELPLTIDIEMGYGKTKEKILENISVLAETGVVGINIEDSIIHGSKRSLGDAGSFAKTIEFMRHGLKLKGLELFINVRCDTYILNVENKLKETRSRVKAYESAGADGIFLPCISNEEDIAAALEATALPLNVMCIPGLPNFDILNRLGVKRVSMGPFLFNKLYDNIAVFSRAIESNRDFSPILT